MKKIILLVCTMFSLVMFSGCYWNAQVKSNEMGLVLKDGASVDSVVSAGRHSSGNWFASLEKIDVSAKITTWEDPDLWTSDKQSVKFSVSVTYARNRNNVTGMYTKYNLESQDDEALERLVLARIPRVAKQITTSLTLDEMLGITEGGGRELMQNQMFDLLQAELAECYVELLDIGVNDITPDETYANKLKEKAAAKVESELAVQKTAQLAEQVKQEEAQTKVALEIAKRENLVAEEKNKVFQESSQAFELEKLKLLKDILGNTDKVYFIPEGSDLTLYLAGDEAPQVIKE